MNTLSLSSINSNSPYEVRTRGDETYSFITDSSIEIFVSFEKDDILQSGLSYQFGISNPKGSKSPRDSKVRDTILAIVQEFFEKNQAGLLYICETGDGMQKMSKVVFSDISSYFKKFLKRKTSQLLGGKDGTAYNN